MKIRIPLVFYVTDMIGTIFIGIGAWVLVTEDEISIPGEFDRTMAGAGMLTVGILLVIPFVVVLILTIRRNQAAERIR